MEKELIPDPNNSFQKKRIGFQADIIVYVVGTSFDGRQEKLAQLYQDCTPDDTPACSLVREPNNQYDSGAVAVHVIIGDVSTAIGYIPKNYEVPCRSTSGTFHYDGDNNIERRPLWKIMDKRYGTIKVGLEGVWEVQSNYGARVGIAHEM